MSIFSILNHARLFLVYSSHFGVLLSYQTNICGFRHIEGNFARCKKRLSRDVAPVTFPANSKMESSLPRHLRLNAKGISCNLRTQRNAAQQ